MKKTGPLGPEMISVEFSDYGLDTPYTCSGTLFLLDLESLKFFGVGDMRPSAHLCGYISDLVHLDDLSVLVGEYSDDSFGLCLLVGHLLAHDRDLGLDAFVDPILDLLELFGSYLPIKVEIESKPLCGNVRSFLLNVR